MTANGERALVDNHSTLHITRSRIIRAAEYVRMSTDRQEVSISYQQTAIRKYAEERGMAVVRTYADEGKSGLHLKGRTALIQLLSDVQRGIADFEIVLIHDVSRWGRFQDTDESGYYEYMCRRANVRVEYCAEQFQNDGTSLSALMKNIKRTMAAEYSRDLSDKMHKSLCKVTSLGYLGGGIPNYGLRRMLVSPSGERKGIMERLVYKSFKGERTILVLGPSNEVETVNRIFHQYVNLRLSPSKIADLLNQDGIPTARGVRWYATAIRSMLRNERYAGTLTYNHRSKKLRTYMFKNDPDQWVHVPDAIEPIISREMFDSAQAILIQRRVIKRKDEPLLERLRYLLQTHGMLSQSIINADKGGSPLWVYEKQFGSLGRAYAQIGYDSPNDKTDREASNERKREIFRNLQATLRDRGWRCDWNAHRRQLLIDYSLNLGILIGKYNPTPLHRKHRWFVHTYSKTATDLTIVVRLDFANQNVLDYFLFPKSLIRPYKMNLTENLYPQLRTYRFVTYERLVAGLVIQLALHKNLSKGTETIAKPVQT
jgi:DNA invertase Pin-like site-specific DNA recombinase